MHWTEVFALGTFWFWVLLAVETVVIICLIEWGKGTFATLSLVATLLLLHFLGGVNLAGYVLEHPITVLTIALGYFAAGTVWAITKWWFHVHEQRARYDEARQQFSQLHGLAGSIPDKLRPQWVEFLEVQGSGRHRIEVRPRAREHKARILTWMTYWPWSLTWTVLNDPVRKAFLYIYRQIQDHLQEISDRAFRGVEDDFPRSATVAGGAKAETRS